MSVAAPLPAIVISDVSYRSIEAPSQRLGLRLLKVVRLSPDTVVGDVTYSAAISFELLQIGRS